MPVIHTEPAWVLHSRPFRENSKIYDFVTLHHGKISLLAKMRATKDNKRALLQPFYPILISFALRGELPLLRQVEPASAPYLLSGEALWCGMYLNELMLKVLRKNESTPEIFAAYQEAIDGLSSLASSKKEFEIILRRFELTTLFSLGYGFSFSKEAETHAPILPQTEYLFQIRLGFIPRTTVDAAVTGFLGADLLAIANETYTDNALKILKYLMRLAYQDILGENSIQSRTLWSIK